MSVWDVQHSYSTTESISECYSKKKNFILFEFESIFYLNKNKKKKEVLKGFLLIAFLFVYLKVKKKFLGKRTNLNEIEVVYSILYLKLK